MLPPPRLGPRAGRLPIVGDRAERRTRSSSELWRQRGIDIFDLPLDEYVAGLSSRIAAEVPAHEQAESLSPYRGLTPFEDSDLDVLFFFGRERERELIEANLMASRLTVLYGETGVGKSSVLRAGVAHHLRGQARANLEERGRAGARGRRLRRVARRPGAGAPQRGRATR